MIKDERKIQPGTVDCKGFWHTRSRAVFFKNVYLLSHFRCFTRLLTTRASMVSILFTLLGRAF